MSIGWEGKTLRQMLEGSEKIFEETGCYYLPKELPLREEDPLKFERFQTRIIAAAIEARDVVKYGCASPGTRELGELIFMAFTPEGDCIGHGTGLVSHIVTESNGIKWLVKNDYSDEDIAKVMGQNIIQVLKDVWQ